MAGTLARKNASRMTSSVRRRGASVGREARTPPRRRAWTRSRRSRPLGVRLPSSTR
jgi:hypothetical protein